MSIGEFTSEFVASCGKPLIFIDEIAAGALLEDSVVIECIRKPVRVQTMGHYTRYEYNTPLLQPSVMCVFVGLP